MAYFPLFIDMKGRQVLVVGGGFVAERRIHSLLPFECEIRVIAPEITETLAREAEEGKIQWVKAAYEKRYLDEREGGHTPVFVLAAVNEEVNGQVAEDCREAGIPVNDSSRRDRCDFYFPGLVKHGEAVAGVTSGGGDHKLAAALTARVRQVFAELNL